MSDNFNFPVKCGYERITPGDFVDINSTDLSYRYAYSSPLIVAPLVDTDDVNNTTFMCLSCSKLEGVGYFDTSNVTDMNGMFNGCEMLITIPQFNTSKVTNMGSMFAGCAWLRKIPKLNTSNVTSMNQMFLHCGNLTSIPLLDTGNVVDMQNMFYNCNKLISIPQLDTSNVNSTGYIFDGCASLTSIPLLDWGKVQYAYSVFGSWLELTHLTDLGGFKDLGKQSFVDGLSSGFLDKAPNLTHESLMNVINNLYDRRANGLPTLSIMFGETHLNNLEWEEKVIAINKGWTLIG